MCAKKLLGVLFVLWLLGACGTGETSNRPGDARRDAMSAETARDVVDDLAVGDTGGIDVGEMNDGDGSTSMDAPVVSDGGPVMDAADVPPETMDAARDARGPDACVPGTVTCVTADRTRTCLPDGGYAEADCPAGQICVDRIGCALCEPGAVRCASDGLTLETCAGDGMRWMPGMRCDSSMGLVCEGYRCVNACARAASQRSYLGCEYWPTTLSNSQLPSVFTFAVTVANPQSYPVQVTFSGGALSAPRTVTVMPNTTHTEELPWVNELAQRGTFSANSVLRPGGAYRLVSTAPIAAYQFNPLRFQQGGSYSYTNDASLLLPTHVLTGNYMAITHQSWLRFGGQLAIVGVSATPTTVRVNLRTSIRGGTGVSASGPGTVTYTLHRGDVVQLISAGPSAGTCGPEDLTGTTVSASQPVAVFVGHDCTQMPCGWVACDHLEEQLFPNETWGRSYVVSALRERSASEVSVVRILSQTADNALAFDGIARPAACPAVLGAGQFCEFETSQDFAVSGTGPLLIAQFMVGQGRVAGVGDPAMVLEVPTQQFRSNYVFNVPESYTNNFLTVVYPTGMLPQLDGRTIAAGTAVGTTGFSVSRFSVTPGSHRMVGPAPFGIKVTGTASYTSYMYPGGLDLNQITGP